MLPDDGAKKIPEKGTALGYSSYGDAAVVSETDKIPLKKGMAFGFDFHLEGLPTDRPFHVKYVTTHPRMVKPDGTVLFQQVSEHDETVPMGDGDGHYWYTMRESFEVVPGEWTLAVWYNDKVLVQRKFVVGSTGASSASTTPPKL